MSATRHIAFGWDRETDEASLREFLRKFGREALLAALVPRMTDEEITATVDHLSTLMRRHLSEKEYHSLFLDGKDG